MNGNNRKIPPGGLVCFLRKDGKFVYRKIPGAKVLKWDQWQLIPSHMTADEYIAACKDIGLEVKWLNQL